jgi:hypothetical protein
LTVLRISSRGEDKSVELCVFLSDGTSRSTHGSVSYGSLRLVVAAEEVFLGRVVVHVTRSARQMVVTVGFISPDVEVFVDLPWLA